MSTLPACSEKRLVEDRVEIVKVSQTPALDRAGDGCKIRILSAPQDAGRFEVYELIFADGGKLESKPHERGTREQLIAEEGNLEGHVRRCHGDD
jgi:hypothetical protein